LPWEKKFDSDQALASAMEAFWARGYEATSMEDLVQSMGINRGSLYASFGDKRRLFLQSLERYDREYREARCRNLRQDPSPRRAILRAFEEPIDAALKGKSRQGCFLVNTALELSPHDPDVATIVSRGLTGMEDFFREMVERGQTLGKIPGNKDAGETAQGLLSLLVALRVFSRSRPEKALLQGLARQAEALLG
jgi:TetR/AcrR family transcriptional repressor of nem operon